MNVPVLVSSAGSSLLGDLWGKQNMVERLVIFFGEKTGSDSWLWSEIKFISCSGKQASRKISLELSPDSLLASSMVD